MFECIEKILIIQWVCWTCYSTSPEENVGPESLGVTLGRANKNTSHIQKSDRRSKMDEPKMASRSGLEKEGERSCKWCPTVHMRCKKNSPTGWFYKLSPSSFTHAH